MTITLTIGGRYVQHPAPAIRQAQQYGTPQEFWGRVNSYWCPRGEQAGKAWLLMRRSDLDALDADSFHSLVWTDGSRRLVVARLAIVSSMCMNRALAGSETASHLVEFEDVRRMLKFSSVDSQYNIRRPAPAAASGTGQFYADSLNGGSLWTWQTMLDDLWSNLPSVAGDAPTMPYNPVGPPEEWRFLGVDAWSAIHDVLVRCGCTTAYNPITESFSYVRLGTTQTDDGQTVANRLDRLANRLLYDFDPQDYSLSQIPETIRVHFHRRTQYYGVEKDTPNTANWEMNPSTSKDYATGVAGALAGSVLPVWDDYPALYDEDGNLVLEAALTARANDVGANIVARMSAADSRRHISGIETGILPGAEISEVLWRDYGDEKGLITELVREPPQQAVIDILTNERLGPPDFARGTHPLYPRVAQLVQVDDGATATGEKISANGDGLYPGYVLQWAAGAWTTLEACWIRPSDLDQEAPFSEATVVDLRQKDRFIGRLSGIETSGGTTYPVYIVRGGGLSSGELHYITADETIPGSPIVLHHFETLDFDATDAAWSTEAHGTQAERGIVVQADDQGTTVHVRIAVDKSVLQEVKLEGSATSANTVNVEDGDRNSVTLDASDTSPITLTKAVDHIQIAANDPFHVIETDHATLNSQDLDYDDTLKFTTDGSTKPEVTKAGTTVTVKIPEGGGELPVGSVIMGVKAPVLSGGKYYLDDGAGSADTDWALMDGTSNSTPGSGVSFWDRTGGGRTYYPRGYESLADAPVSAVGRSLSMVAGSTINDDEVEIDFFDHTDHAHLVSGDVCDTIDPTSDNAWYFSGTTRQTCTSGVKSLSTCGTAASTVLGHTKNFTNGQGGTYDIELTPPTKRIHFFEKVA